MLFENLTLYYQKFYDIPEITLCRQPIRIFIDPIRVRESSKLTLDVCDDGYDHYLILIKMLMVSLLFSLLIALLENAAPIKNE